MDNRIIDVIEALVKAKRYGILQPEDVDKQLKMNLEKYIEAQFLLCDATLKVSYLASNKMYRIRVPLKVQKELGLRPQYFGATELVVLTKVYESLYTFSRTGARIQDVYQAFMAERENDPDIARDTIRKNRNSWKYIENSDLTEKSMRDITIDDLSRLFKSMTQGRKMTRSNFNNFKTFLNLLWDYAVEDYRACDHNIAREIRSSRYKFKPTSNRLTDVYTTDEVDRLWTYMIEKNTVYSLACALSFCLGCRACEIKALRWQDIDFDRNIIYISSEVTAEGYSNQQVFRDHTKSGLTEGAREIPFFSDGLLTLQKIKLLNCDEEFLFLGKSGKFILTQEINQNLKEACKDLGITYRSSHKIRKWAATEAVRQGMDEVSLMYSFGWKNRQTAEHYIRAGRTQQSQLAILSKVFDRTAETNLTDCN